MPETPLFDPKKGRLIAVSNRTAVDPNARAGGLAVALWDTLVETKGVWVGWSGRVKDYAGNKLQTKLDDGVEFALCDMSKIQYEEFYLGYSNSVLWPLLHNRLDLAVLDNKFYEAYCEINEKFAEIISGISGKDDFIWVHDYHFFLLASYFRQKNLEAKTGFFLHIPFPAPEIFRALPQHDIIGRALCDYDVIGLQTDNDVRNFKRFLSEDHNGEVISDEQMKVGDRIITIRHCPIGMNAPEFSETANSKMAKDAAESLNRFLGGRQLIIGVDRMDYSKGLPQRFEAVGRLFDSYPKTHGNVSFTQIAPPSRSIVDEYAHLRETLDQLAGRINGDYGDLDWIPIRYLARSYSREEIAGLYKMADVCLVTPLQDGMNLVAKEFIAAQDPNDPGVLVLSQFAGASEQMNDALIVNPHDTDSVADAISQALKMPIDERKTRWAALYKNICEEDIVWWRKRFFAPVKTITSEIAATK
ncbi:alpha,alpha-trehalose-phosphate synthase (UDP-forming) [Hellea balneolensis]|uniref:alpha,alpha-trehalose-phosphate synthase (UDP-forming) n=1 Tax=Hellea balneolensis TaxID=287478 RepID=UPI000425E4C9|nr:trehalose-6-phosphate synthase [Hellea balneolensis]